MFRIAQRKSARRSFMDSDNETKNNFIILVLNSANISYIGSENNKFLNVLE